MVRNPKSEKKTWQTLKIEDLTFDLSVVTQRESKRWRKNQDLGLKLLVNVRLSDMRDWVCTRVRYDRDWELNVDDWGFYNYVCDWEWERASRSTFMFLSVKWENVRRQGNKTKSKWVNAVMQTLKIKMQAFNIKTTSFGILYGAWVCYHRLVYYTWHCMNII